MPMPLLLLKRPRLLGSGLPVDGTSANARLTWLKGAAEHLSRRGSVTLQSAKQKTWSEYQKYGSTWDHEQHRVDLDEPICGWLACDATVDLAKHQNSRQCKEQQGSNLDCCVGQHQLLDSADAMARLYRCHSHRATSEAFSVLMLPHATWLLMGYALCQVMSH